MEIGLSGKKNVVVITTLFPNQKEPQRGLYVFQIAKELEKFYRLHVIAPVPWFPGFRVLRKFESWHMFSQVPKLETYDGIDVYHPRYFMVPKIWGPLLALSVFLAIFGLLKGMKERGDAEAINAHWIYPDGVGATLAARFLKIPIVLSALGSDINLYIEFLLRRIQMEWALNRAQGITTVADALKEKIVKLGIRPSKVRTIPNGVDRNRFFVKPKKESRTLLGLGKDFKLILFVGSFEQLPGSAHTIKGSEYLVEAVSILRRAYEENFKLVLIGGGPLKDVIQRRAKKVGISGITSFLGRRPYEEIPLWMNACDVFVRPSLIDGMPNVVLEALACGRPVVVSRLGSLPLMVNSENGVLVQPGDPEAMARALKQVLMKKWDKEKIVSSVEGLTWEKCAKGYFEELEKAMGTCG